jgi:hypothetical protein
MFSDDLPSVGVLFFSFLRRLSQTEDIEPERRGSAGLDFIVGENATQTHGLHCRQVQSVEGSAVHRTTEGEKLTDSDSVNSGRCGKQLKRGGREGLVEKASERGRCSSREQSTCDATLDLNYGFEASERGHHDTGLSGD